MERVDRLQVVLGPGPDHQPLGHRPGRELEPLAPVAVLVAQGHGLVALGETRIDEPPPKGSVKNFRWFALEWAADTV